MAGIRQRCASVHSPHGDFDAHFAAEKAVWNLTENACAVARFFVASDGASVFEVLQNGERIGNDGMARFLCEISDYSDAARIVLVLAKVEAAGTR
jgi:hypothetical protein